MIVAIASIKNEAPIITHTVTHLLGNGIDRVLISVGESDDSTYDIAMALPDTVYVARQEGPFDQGVEMTRLAHEAANELGATWIAPFDADEFWCGQADETVASVIHAQPPTIIRIHAPVYTHVDRQTRYVAPKLWGKVAFRPHPEMSLTWGSHHVHNGPGEAIHGILTIRELQYQSYDHFLSKVAKAHALFDSWAVPMEYGSHMRELVTMDDQALHAAYTAHCAVDTIHDPIPYRGDEWV